MTDDAAVATLALVRDLASGLGLPVATGPEAEARFTDILRTIETLNPGATTRLRTGLTDRLHEAGAEARATGAVQ
ncbi:hypothetical protein [Brevundimonas sp.]|uniref:hypothetical protein n=1 Tax=Brevundimonas sp. TaxID=1871086 RepID=UPI003F707834